MWRTNVEKDQYITAMSPSAVANAAPDANNRATMLDPMPRCDEAAIAPKIVFTKLCLEYKSFP